MSVMTSKELKARYEELLNGLHYAVHELPAGVLFGSDGANHKQCNELMADLNEFEQLCLELALPQPEFIEACRWHFDHYPHYLGRRRHFESYAQYTIDRSGPINVPRARR